MCPYLPFIDRCFRAVEQNMTSAQLIQLAHEAFEKGYAMNTTQKLSLDPANPADSSVIDDAERERFAVSFVRRLRAGFQGYDNLITNIHTRHMADYALGLLIAKKQMTGDFQGTDGTDGIVVEYDPRAAFFGLGDGWRSANGTTAVYPATAGSPQNWIHSGSTRLGGTAGNPIIFGQAFVGVIVGYAIYSDDIVRTSVILESINRQPAAAIAIHGTMAQSHLNYPLKLVELDRPHFLRANNNFRVQVFQETAAPASEYAYPLGAVFTTGNVLQETDLGNVDATGLNNLKVLNTVA
jgi:hypothetical protein